MRPRLLPDPVGLKFVNLEAPPDWDAEFGFSGPLELEIGSGARFDMRTDVEDRGRGMLAILEEAGFVNPLGRGAFHPYDPEEVPSTRERRYLLIHAPVYRARLIKPATPTPET